MGAKWSGKIEIDTTHLICTTPAGGLGGAGGSPVGNPRSTVGSVGGVAPIVLYQRAVQLSIPVLQPGWILACHTEQRCIFFLHSSFFFLLSSFILIPMFVMLCMMVPVSHHYLSASPPAPHERTPVAHKSSPSLSQSLKSLSLPAGARSQPGSAGTGTGAGAGPAPSSAPIAGVAGNAPTATATDEYTIPPPLHIFPRRYSTHDSGATLTMTSKESKRKSRLASMNKEFTFRFPIPSPTESTKYA
jgi:chitin biosynthesis protein CHS5